MRVRYDFFRRFPGAHAADAVDEDSAAHSGELPEAGPGADVVLGHKSCRQSGAEDDNIQVAEVVGGDERASGGRCTFHAIADAERSKDHAAAEVHPLRALHGRDAAASQALPERSCREPERAEEERCQQKKAAPGGPYVSTHAVKKSEPLQEDSLEG